MVEEVVASKPVRPQPTLPKATIVRREDVTADLWKIWLQPEVPFSFKPGQYCTIGLEGIERAYSIVSAPHEPYLELFIELVPHGELTPRLWKLREGAQVSIRPRAKGIFTFDPKWRNHVMVATVTGVVPYVSILRDYLHNKRTGHRFFLLQGASYHDEFGYDRELGEYARRYPGEITYVPTVSRPHEERNRGWQGQTGRVNLILEEYLLRWGLSPHDTLLYACGHPGMIEDVKARFIPKGWKVKEERFWK
jgi:NAD(P)H-flavin reductase